MLFFFSFLLTRQIMWAFYTSQQFSETLRGVKSDAHAQTVPPEIKRFSLVFNLDLFLS